jgi:hypothetical protein
MALTAEELRLAEARAGTPWRAWGPYLSERQWGTVREDYSDNGDAWSYFSHDQARSRAYRWGEDGLAGISDDRQRLCFAVALWNEQDPILKERLFGLTNAEGNHGEDVKEYYFYLDNLPTHSYQRWLYKYPQAAFPYADLVDSNRARNRYELEYELLDTGVFDHDRYFDVEVEYAKGAPDDIACRITVHNRGPQDAPVHVLPTVWFRNTWSFPPHDPRPSLRREGDGTVRADHPELGEWFLHAQDGADLLFCDNESNAARLWGSANATPFVKDGINDHVVAGAASVNPAGEGTKAAARYRAVVPAGGSAVFRVRLAAAATAGAPGRAAGRDDAIAGVDDLIALRRAEADAFYESMTPPNLDADSASVMRQALAGMLWSKQTYYFDLDTWLRERGCHPLRSRARRGTRNEQWHHMTNFDVISMPDKWEYPWYAAWDLAFHCIPLGMVDLDFAKDQLELMLTRNYLHPTGQLPAYEWNFGDVNPPVHAFAMLFLMGLHSSSSDHSSDGAGLDVAFLQDAFPKLLLNFTWWVNRKDPTGRNVFEGGFLGLDNIGVFDRSAPLPTGGRLEQADGTAWMALFALNMLEIAGGLAMTDPSYEDFIYKFLEHFLLIAAATDPLGEGTDEMWDDEDGFFYDVLRLPDGTGQRLRVRSLVGLLPLCATTVVSGALVDRYPHLFERIGKYLDRNRDLLANIPDPTAPGPTGRLLLSLVNESKLRRVLTRMLDEERFLSPHGIRSLSRWHLDHPYTLDVHGQQYTVQYEAAESTTGMFGGNSNWRGPVWFPVNLLIVRALLLQYSFYGDTFTIECPTGSGNEMTLFEVAREITRRLVSTFLTDEHGERPVYGGARKFQDDPHWRDHVLFYEYFHGDNGAGLGASHQTGWSGVVARLIQMLATLTPDDLLSGAGRPMARAYRRPE